MGIYLSYDEQKQMWKWTGVGFVKYFKTKQEAENAQAEMWQLHLLNIKMFHMVASLCMDQPGSRHQFI